MVEMITHGRIGALRRCVRPASASLIVLLALAQCSNSHAANKKNFKAALSKYLGKRCMILDVDVDSSSNDSKPPKQFPKIDFRPPQLAALEAAGVIEKKKIREVGRESNGTPIYLGTKTEINWTSSGRKLWRVIKSVMPETGLCAGHFEVRSVDKFTQPATRFGVKISMVTFSFRKRLEPWAATPKMKAAFPDTLGGPKTGQITFPLELTNDGWAVANNLPAYQ